MVLQDAIDNLVELLGILCPVYLHAVLLGIGGKLVKIFIQMGDGMALNLGCFLAQLFPFVKPVGHVVALAAYRPEGGVMPVGILLVLQELLGCFAVLCTHLVYLRFDNYLFTICFFILLFDYLRLTKSIIGIVNKS